MSSRELSPAETSCPNLRAAQKGQDPKNLCMTETVNAQNSEMKLIRNS